MSKMGVENSIFVRLLIQRTSTKNFYFIPSPQSAVRSPCFILTTDRITPYHMSSGGARVQVSSWCLAQKITNWPKLTSKTWTEPCKNNIGSIKDIQPKNSQSTNINHKGLQRTANEYAEKRRIYKDLISKKYDKCRHNKFCKQNTADRTRTFAVLVRSALQYSACRI